MGQHARDFFFLQMARELYHHVGLFREDLFKIFSHRIYVLFGSRTTTFASTIIFIVDESVEDFFC